METTARRKHFKYFKYKCYDTISEKNQVSIHCFPPTHCVYPYLHCSCLAPSLWCSPWTRWNLAASPILTRQSPLESQRNRGYSTYRRPSQISVPMRTMRNGGGNKVKRAHLWHRTGSWWINTYLVIDGDVAIGKGVGPQHAGLDVVVFVHAHVLFECHLRSLPLGNLFEFRSHIEKVQVRAVPSVEPCWYNPVTCRNHT